MFLIRDWYCAMTNNNMINTARAKGGVNGSFLKKKQYLSFELSSPYVEISDVRLETSDNDNQCRVITRTSGIARTAQLFCDPKNFAMIFSGNRQDIPSKMKTSNNTSRTGQGRGSTVSHEGTDDAVDAEDPAQDPSSTSFDSVVSRIRLGTEASRSGPSRSIEPIRFRDLGLAHDDQVLRRS